MISSPEKKINGDVLQHDLWLPSLEALGKHEYLLSLACNLSMEAA